MDFRFRGDRSRIVPGGIYDPQNLGSSKAAMGVSMLEVFNEQKLHFLPFPDPKSKTVENAGQSK